MSDLISRDALLEIIKARHKRLENPNDAISIIVQNELSSVMDEINDAPTIDAVPVAHGRWVPDTYFRQHVMRCSACQMGFAEGHHAERFPFCPNCGAKMDAKGKSDEG